MPLFAVPRNEGCGREREGAVGIPERDTAVTPVRRHDGGGAMRTAIAMPGNTTSTFLVHLLGGLTDDPAWSSGSPGRRRIFVRSRRRRRRVEGGPQPPER